MITGMFKVEKLLHQKSCEEFEFDVYEMSF